jgi:plasmid rolling circle replication initiator protein Rep
VPFRSQPNQPKLKLNNLKGTIAQESHLLSGLQPIPIISDSSEIGVALSAISPRDARWDKHRKNADTIEKYYSCFDCYQKYAERMSVCSKFLDFKLVPKIATENEIEELGCLVLKLSSAHFCRCRHCPVCQWRRALMWRAKFTQVLPKILEDYSTHRWIRLTLTIKNPRITELREGIELLNSSFKKMTKRKGFPGVGWVKSVEVTKSKAHFADTELMINGQLITKNIATAHPHLHILMAVKPSYFKNKKFFLNFTQWVEMWKSCLQVEYEPDIDIRAVGENKKLLTCLPEMLKYQVKESDLVDDRDWFLEMNKQLHKTRAVEVGGILKPYLKALENEPADLIGEGDEDEVDEGHLFFLWQKMIKKYTNVGSRD